METVEEVRYNEVMEEFKSLDLSEYKKHIIRTFEEKMPHA